MDSAATYEDAVEPPTADADDAFDAGYGWARMQDVQDRRECRQLEDREARQGCRTYLSDLRDRGWEPRYAEDGYPR